MDNHDNNRNRGFFSAIRLRFPWLQSLIGFVRYRVILLHDHEMFYFSSVSVVLNFLNIKYQGTKKTPFDTHPKTMNVGVISCCLLAYLTVVQAVAPARFSAFLKHLVFCFWSLATASFVSSFVSDVVGVIVYVLCLAPSIIGLLHYVHRIVWSKFRASQRQEIGRLHR